MLQCLYPGQQRVALCTHTVTYIRRLSIKWAYEDKPSSLYLLLGVCHSSWGWITYRKSDHVNEEWVGMGRNGSEGSGSGKRDLSWNVTGDGWTWV